MTTPREERRRGLRPDPWGWIFVLAAGATLWGCGPTTRAVPAPAQIGDQSPLTGLLMISNGPVVYYPDWLDLPQHATHRAAMIDEIRTVQPEADPRISPALRGVPSGVTLIVLDPGAYAAPYSPTGLASGEWRAPSTIYVAWRGTNTGPTLPALPHEIRHLLTGDPNAGH